MPVLQIDVEPETKLATSHLARQQSPRSIDDNDRRGYLGFSQELPQAHTKELSAAADSGSAPSLFLGIAGSEPVAPASSLRTAGILVTLASVSLLNTFNSGMLTVALPDIAKELKIPPSLQLWPASVYSLGLSCGLLPLGAIADLVGNRPVFLFGLLLYTAFTLAVSLAHTGGELIAFRTVQGVAMAFCMPPAVSIITSTFPAGRTRNIAFAVYGGGNPVGFALGLVLGGVFVKIASWRAGYWMSTSINAAAMLLAFFCVPKRSPESKQALLRTLTYRIAHELDWVGVGSSSACLALLSYLFAELAYGATRFVRRPHAIVLFVLAGLLFVFFVFWEGRQEKLGRPAILPNGIWRRREFITVCVSVFLTWSWFNAFSYWATLFYQESQQLDALQTALRFLPVVIAGLGTNVVAAYIMDRVSAGTVSLVGGVVSTVAPLLFALQDVSWMYWQSAFPAMVISVISTDLLFNVSNLVITTNFPGKSQALAGGIFNTVAQLGNSLGLAVTAMIAASVQEASGGNKIATSGGITYNSSMLQGYRSGFWACFAASITATLISSIGLRIAGKVGGKEQ
ncbi:MFS general substrate transporter [Colletotrichum zoysiae]|uniref:MFS general substrate transporter n=1 Tax=Colletotrichum zoysiae TaxID=1216348 RepID=A0AAD9H1Q7_9PEZI|nr:MFS general substrate transporter [Colletotrichum zoysiae]